MPDKPPRDWKATMLEKSRSMLINNEKLHRRIAAQKLIEDMAEIEEMFRLDQEREDEVNLRNTQ